MSEIDNELELAIEACAILSKENEELKAQLAEKEKQFEEARERIKVLSQKLKLSKATASSAIKEIE